MYDLLLLPASLVLLLSTGTVYQWLAARRDRRKFIASGKLVNIGGAGRLYLVQKGSEHPAVIFESGIAATSLNWLLVQDSVSAFARTIAYDRGGLGWSSAHASERTPSNIARELHDMLRRAGVEPPYVLVGHSFGALVMRRYALEYPEDVAGVVLIDPMRPAEWLRNNEEQSAMVERGMRMTGYAVAIARIGLARLAVTSLLCRSGALSRALSRAAGTDGEHVMERIVCEVGKMPRDIWPAVAAHWSRSDFYTGMMAHLEAVHDSAEEMHLAGPIVTAPVLLLTAGTAVPLSAFEMDRIGLDTHQVIAEKSGHWVHLDQPELVIEAIRTMVEQTRVAQRDSDLAAV